MLKLRDLYNDGHKINLDYHPWPLFNLHHLVCHWKTQWEELALPFHLRKWPNPEHVSPQFEMWLDCLAMDWYKGVMISFLIDVFMSIYALIRLWITFTTYEINIGMFCGLCPQCSKWGTPSALAIRPLPSLQMIECTTWGWSHFLYLSIQCFKW